MPLVYLSLGSNLGNRSEYLRQALARIDEKYHLERVSSVYETSAWGKTDQPDFLNMVVCLSTEQGPYELLEWLQKLELELGRVRHERWGERTIDIDILFYGDRTIRHPEGVLTIPHPRLWERAFVLVPLLEIAPDMKFGGRYLRSELDRLDTGGVTLYAKTTTDR
ncbi:MAG: 2-amino-4-hydroxy-6-hydroxymethyldihydropteridine diphosphokinase [Tissierellia bacterium]|nr:2-amino-4-hydroxy-6-hydroxymethyldihydropteridine diphosphokinase [Tissierellia bacterium]